MNRYSNTYFQNCAKEWNLLDISVQSSQTISELKKKLIQLVRPVKRSIFNVHDLYGVKLLTEHCIEFSDLRSHRYNHNFYCPEPYCSCQLACKIRNIFFCTARACLLSVKTVLDLVSNLVRTDIMRPSSKELCTLILYGHNDFSFPVNRGVIEQTIKYIRNVNMNINKSMKILNGFCCPKGLEKK